MIIKTLLDELFTQLREIIEFDNIEIYKIIGHNEIQRYYFSPDNNLQTYNLDKIMNKLVKENYIFEIIKFKKEIIIENIDSKKNISMNLIPIIFEDNTVFFINIIVNDKKFDFTEEQKENRLEIISSFNEVFCFEEMIKIDRIRDRMALNF